MKVAFEKYFLPRLCNKYVRLQIEFLLLTLYGAQISVGKYWGEFGGGAASLPPNLRK